MKLVVALSLAAVAVVGLASPASADPAEVDYKVICVQPVVADAPVGPKTCVPVPVEP